MSSIGTKIRDTYFSDIPVSIYQKGNEYFLEYEDGGSKDIHFCGTNTMFWETMSEIFGEGQAPDGFEIVDLVNQVENRITNAISTSQLKALITEVVDSHTCLVPAYIEEEIFGAIMQRLYEGASGYYKPTSIDMEKFLEHAIKTAMIFRTGVNQKYARIKQVVHKGDTIYLTLSDVNIEYDKDENPYWCEDSFHLVKLEDAMLTHHKIDELPAEYTE